MSEVVTLVAIAFLLAGVVGSFVPLVPSGLLSLVGVWTYYLFADGAEMGILALALLTLLAIAAAIFEHFAGAIAARASGASTRTMILAAAAGIALFFVTGPLGIVFGIFGAVVLSELRGGTDLRTAMRRGSVTVVGVLGSSVVQFLFTLTILIGFVAVVLLW